VTLVNEQTAYRKKFPGGQSVTLIPRGTDPPVYAFGRYDAETMMGSFATIIDTDGQRVANLLPAATRHRDMVASPDGRYLLASTGTHRLSIYKTDGSRFPFMNFVQMNGEWILWTPEGYYTASPSGERLIGWAVTNGANELVRYYPVERFAKHFRRPDLMKLAFEKGSVKLALESLGATAAGFDLPLPPTASLALVEQRDGKAVVKANARSGAKDQPLTAMHLLLDGRPLPAGRGVWKAAPGEVANETFEFDVPAGTHELKLYVRAGDVATLSEALTLKGPRTAANRTTLHRLCIGIDNYDDRTIPRIGNAAKDAKAIHEALAAECVGESNRFGATAGELLLDKAATRDRILKSLDEARRLVKPGDLLAIYFSGHGWKLDKDYYLLTSDAGPNGKLDGRSLSGADLRKALKDFNCPVLLLLDARHAAAGASPARSAIDDLARELCDETVGATVLSAAMAHETPATSAGNGGFAQGLLKGLKAGKDVPFDPYERVLYTNHLHMVTFSEVRRETKGRQNPFLHSPWTATPIALRLVP
jgi:Caspase domain